MAETSSRSDRFARAPAQPRRQRQRIGLGSAGGEHHILRPGADGRRDGGAGILDQPARLPPFGMDRGRIAGHLPGGRHRLPAPRGAAAWSHSSRDRPGQAFPYNITYIGQRLPRASASQRAPDALSQLGIAPSLTIA